MDPGHVLTAAGNGPAQLSRAIRNRTSNTPPRSGLITIAERKATRRVPGPPPPSEQPPSSGRFARCTPSVRHPWFVPADDTAVLVVQGVSSVGEMVAVLICNHTFGGRTAWAIACPRPGWTPPASPSSASGSRPCSGRRPCDLPGSPPRRPHRPRPPSLPVAAVHPRCRTLAPVRWMPAEHHYPWPRAAKARLRIPPT